MIQNASLKLVPVELFVRMMQVAMKEMRAMKMIDICSVDITDGDHVKFSLGS